MQQEAAAAAPPLAAQPQAYAPPAVPAPPPPAAAQAQPQPESDAEYRADLAALNRKLLLMKLPTLPYLPPARRSKAELDEGLQRMAAGGGRYARFASAFLDLRKCVDQYRRCSLRKRAPLAPISPPNKKGRG